LENVKISRESSERKNKVGTLQGSIGDIRRKGSEVDLLLLKRDRWQVPHGTSIGFRKAQASILRSCLGSEIETERNN
jgi:hypothetical protein